MMYDTWHKDQNGREVQWTDVLFYLDKPPTNKPECVCEWQAAVLGWWRGLEVKGG